MKKMPFSQAVLGPKSSKTRPKGQGTLVSSHMGMVDKSPSKKMAPKKSSKRVY